VSSPDQPIIRKVKKVSGEGHHGGAWKVAYADFVTAMMAFFLLMWLLNATTEDQRKGIADYFNPTIPVSQISGGGTDLLNGSTIFAEKTLAKDGSGGSKTQQSSSQDETDKQDELEEGESKFKSMLDDGDGAGAAEELNAIEERLRGQIDSVETEGLARHIQTRVTPEGLVIELVDVDGSPLFDVGSTNASPTLKILLKAVTSSLALVQNEISIVGHTDSLAYSGARNYSNWELSTDRANIARRLMVNEGFPQAMIDEVAGKADTEPLVDDRYAPQNRRISITILRS
jgi:chemotaxis protein MotB